MTRTEDGGPVRDSPARLPVRAATREEIRRLKRGGETYDSLLRKMIEQYDPEEADHGR